MKQTSIAGVCGILLLLAACGPSDEQQGLFAEEVAALNEEAEQDSASESRERGSMAAAGDADDPGAAAATSVTLPDNFPDDVVLYPEMELASVTGMSDTMMLQGPPKATWRQSAISISARWKHRAGSTRVI